MDVIDLLEAEEEAEDEDPSLLVHGYEPLETIANKEEDALQRIDLKIASINAEIRALEKKKQTLLAQREKLEDMQYIPILFKESQNQVSSIDRHNQIGFPPPKPNNPNGPWGREVKYLLHDVFCLQNFRRLIFF